MLRLCSSPADAVKPILPNVVRGNVPAEGLLDVGSVVAAIDETLEEDVIVTGALPPQARDLDLLVSDEQAHRLPEVLVKHGFLPRGRNVAPRRVASKQWVMIEGGGARVRLEHVSNRHVCSPFS